MDEFYVIIHVIIISSSSRCMYALLYSVFVCFSANLMKHPNVGHAYEMIRVCFQVVPKAEKLLTWGILYEYIYLLKRSNNNAQWKLYKGNVQMLGPKLWTHEWSTCTRYILPVAVESGLWDGRQVCFMIIARFGLSLRYL